MTLRTAILVRPLTSTYLMSPAYSGGKNFVKASVFSYMWLSASNTGKSTILLAMTTSASRRTAPVPGYRRASASVRAPSDLTTVTSTDPVSVAGFRL